MAHEEASVKENDVFPRIKIWNTDKNIQAIIKSKTSFDGRFVSTLTVDNKLVVIHLKDNYEEVILQETTSFIWEHCDWKFENSLSYPTDTHYLTALDQENSVTIFAVKRNKSFKYSTSLLTLVGPSLFISGNDITEVNEVSLIASFYNVDGSRHQIICLVNRLYLVELVIPTQKEPRIGTSICLCERKQNIGRRDSICLYTFKENLIFFLSEERILSIYSTINFQLLRKIDLYEKLLLYDVQHLGVYGGDKPTLCIVDDINQLHFIKILNLWQEHKAPEKKWSNFWKDHIKETKRKYKQEYGNVNDKHTDHLKITIVPPQEWMETYNVCEISTTKSSISLIFQSKNKTESTKNFVKYNYATKKYFVREISEDVCLCINENEVYPSLFISRSIISLYLYDITQEQLIDTIIQYSDIAQAEIICKANEWNQFSIPLHTLEIGLQHRQLDTIMFFLKSRERVFTRHWKNLTEVQTSAGSGSFSKSFSSQKSYCEQVDSDEMIEAIEMLVKAVHSNSTGKHKQSFYEGLLQLSLKYLNNLLQDGVAAINIKTSTDQTDEHVDSYSQSKSVSSVHSNTIFSFLFDIPDALKYITQKIIELRVYLRKSTTTVIQAKTDNTDVTDGSSLKMSEDMIEQHLTSGKIGALQKLFYLQTGPTLGDLTSIADYGMAIAMKKLKAKQIKDAEKILLNLGLLPNKELKIIYVKTVDRSLRTYLFDVLQQKGLIDKEDLLDYAFIKEVEKLYSSDNFHLASQKHRNVWRTRLRISIPSPLATTFSNVDSNGEVSKEIENLEKDSCCCYCEVSLQYVKSWSAEVRKKILLDGIFLQDAIATLSVCDNSHLWNYLQSHDQIMTMKLWIETLTSSELTLGNQIFPYLNDELGIDFETVTSYSKECLLNELVKHGFYPTCLMNNFPELLHYFSQNNILFNKTHPMLHYKRKITEDEREELIHDFNRKFIDYCQKNDLASLAFYFISHYRLTPQNFKLTDTTKSWLSMMLHFYAASQSSDTNVSSTQDALLYNGCFLHQDISDKSFSLNNIVQHKQPITALAIALVSNVPLNMVIGNDEKTSPFTIEKNLLEQQLRFFPKLHTALFNSSPEDGTTDVSMYRLLHDNTEVDVSRWFGWQSLNEVAAKEENTLTEFPHFSNPFLVKHYAQEVKLSYDYYLQQGRPMFAYLIYLRESKKTRNMSINTTAENVYQLAIQNFLSHSVTSSCSLFIELIDMDCEKIKVDTNAAVLISRNINKRVTTDKKYSPDEIKNLLIQSFLHEKNYQLLLKLLEDSIDVVIHENKINRFSYQAVCHWQLAVQFCRMHDIPISTRYTASCCQEGNWLQFILFIHFYQMPSEQVIHVLETFMKNQILKEHMIAIIKNSKEVNIISYDEKKKRKKSRESKTKETKNTEKAAPRDVRAQFYSRLGAVTTKESGDYQQPLTSTPTKKEKPSENAAREDISSSIGPFVSELKVPDIKKIPDNIIDIVLECEESDQPSAMLLLHSLVLYQPLLSVLAACYEDCNYIACLCIWYICGVDDQLKLITAQKILGVELQFQDISIGLQNHIWVQEDLLVIVKCLLNEGVKYCKLVSQGFIIFKQNDILKYVLQFIESFLYNEDSSQILKLLERFQTEYETHRNKKVIGKQFSTDEELHYCEIFSYNCLMLLLETCSSQYHVLKLVGALADSKYGHMFSIKVPDFDLVKKTAVITYKTNLKCSLQKLCFVDKERWKREIQHLFQLLLDGGHFTEAYDFANLHGLSNNEIILQKAKYELENIKKTDGWCNVEVRFTFWRELNAQFVKNTCNNIVAGSFFQEQALFEPSEYSYEERASLCLLAIKWYNIEKTEETLEIRSQLEKKVWLFKIKAQVNNNTEDKKFNMSSFPVNVGDTSMFSDDKRPYIDISEESKLNELLQNDEVSKSFQKNQISLLGNEKEEIAYKQFLGKLLDENQITEARRVAAYFNRGSRDLEIVLTSILLAQGKQHVEGLSEDLKEILAETTSHHISISGILERSGSFSRPGSLSSHPMSHNTSNCMLDFVFIEEVQNALEKLTLRVNHGKRCCQQVLVSFKIAQILSLSYEEIVTDDHFFTLRRLLDSSVDQRKQLAKQFIKTFELSPDEVGNFIGETMINWIKLACGEDLTASSTSSLVATPSYEDIISLAQLTENTSHIGNDILQEAIKLSKLTQTDGRTSSNLTYEVELLIYSHYCFTIACDMEGIAGVLRAARYCTKALAKMKQHNLMVRLLTGIGRFREMFYVIETLYNQHHFEILCRRGMAKENQLKIALLDFMKRYHPEDIENFNMISLGFGVYREFAQHLETTGNAEIKTLKDQLKGSGKDLIPALKAIGRTFSYAADNYVKDECLRQAQRCHRIARLTELQIQLLPLECVVLGLTPSEVQMFLNQHQSFIEAFIVADSYEMRDVSIWVEPLYQMVVVKGQFVYLQQFLAFLPLSSSLIGDIAVRFRNDKSSSSSNMKKLLNRITDIKTKLKIARELNFTEIENKLLQGSTGAYLRDHMF
ncbi:spatacsin-like [Hydractinia symbiolongicarpus]|uniref:spatacsin-like n=1 Tax=Hydractinia symbiolongicarpus TaxID=13093 RepID=UPI00254AF7D3|nr:spatacsin-like [Hydractinia symbiolongicarpus]